MKFKEIIPLALTTVVLMSLLNYFWSPSDSSKITSDYRSQAHKAPTQEEQQWIRPITTQFNASPVNEDVITITTPLALYTLSNQYAALKEIIYHVGRNPQKLVQAFSAKSSIGASLALALDDTIINSFVLDSIVQDEQCYRLTYKASLETVVCTKIVTIYKYSYLIDMTLTLEGHHTHYAKVIVGSAYLHDIDKNESLQFFTNIAPAPIKFSPLDTTLSYCYWIKPEMIGITDRYFVHALLKDQSSFVDRAYINYPQVPSDTPSVVLESSLGAQGSWNLCLYMGPKEHPSLVAFDARLENTLNYGYFGFVTKPLTSLFSYILNVLKEYSISYGMGIVILVMILRAFMALCGANALALQGANNKQQMDEENNALDQRYKNDKKALLKAKLELTKKHGKPAFLGIAALLLQIPFFLSLSWLLSNSLDFYKTPFLWVPDLSMPDPYYIFSFLLFIAFAGQALVTDDQKQRSSMLMMALFMGFFSSRFCAGTALYIFVGMALMIVPMLYKRVVKR